jgi:TonB family protein
VYKDNQLISNKYRVADGTYINDVFNYVDKNPEYEGGYSELLKYIGENTEYPEKARANKITGRVVVMFILMQDGSIQGIDFLQRVDLLLDFEALRVVSTIPKNKWKPAEIGNKKVNTPVMIPITFSIH